MGKAHGEVCGLFSLGRTPNWRRGTVWGRSTGDEVLRPDHNPPFPISLCPWGGGGRVGSEAEPGKKVGLVFIPHCLTPVLICNKLNYFFPSWVCFSHDSNWWAVFSVLISTQKLSLCVFFPCPEEAEWESSLMGSWCHPRLTHLTLLKEFALGSPGIQILTGPQQDLTQLQALSQKQFRAKQILSVTLPLTYLTSEL